MTANISLPKMGPNMGQRMLADAKFFGSYSRWSETLVKHESWDEAVARVMEMHREKYAHLMSPELVELMVRAEAAYKTKLILGAQRALQFGGRQLRKHEAKMYNCSSSYADRVSFFGEALYLLLCGCGVGFSVQRRHTNKLAPIARRSLDAKVFVIEDSIEGWADAAAVLLSSFFTGDVPFPEYQGFRVLFDYSKIRPKGSPIDGGFRAPGPDGLREALDAIEKLMERALGGADETKLRPIHVYDVVMFLAQAVLSGGVRRSATICLFDKDDDEMLKAKTGMWWDENPQRRRSNNSVVLKRDEVSRDEMAAIMRSVRDFGEPGFVFVDDLDFLFNPCVEIGMYGYAENGESGFQFCNLTEINGGQCTTAKRFYEACEASAILGTLQAGYTDFKYLGDATRRITEREALIGCSITGWMNNPHILFDEAVLKKGAEIIKEVNRKVAALIGIRPAARTTCVKPSGNASVLLGTASGIHGEHAPYFIRHAQMKADEPVAKLIRAINPKMIERDAWSKDENDIVVAFPLVAKSTSIYKKDLLGVKQLEFVKKAQQSWIEHGTTVELCVNPKLRHNVSNTISVDDWDAVEQYIYDNRQWFAGISLLAASGDKAYVQAPFTEVVPAEVMVQKYGEASMFASGLIVDGLHAFGDDLWQACAIAQDNGKDLPGDSAGLLKRDWVRRFWKFADTHFQGDWETTSACLKDSYNLHKWSSITQSMKAINFAKLLAVKDAVDVDTLGSQACAGGACEAF